MTGPGLILNPYQALSLGLETTDIWIIPLPARLYSFLHGNIMRKWPFDSAIVVTALISLLVSM
jgi:hypothetical protein